MESATLEEYRALRQEITERVKVLHFQLNLACIFLFVLVLAITVFGVSNAIMFNWLVLLSFLPFICLGYNYQANQMTLEAVARYISELLRGSTDNFSWDQYWGRYKERVRLVSFMKVFGLLLPVCSIFIWSIVAWSDFLPTQQGVAIFNGLLFVIGVINYRYKFGPISLR